MTLGWTLATEVAQTARPRFAKWLFRRYEYLATLRNGVTPQLLFYLFNEKCPLASRPSSSWMEYQ
jgi:hypothetical protein